MEPFRSGSARRWMFERSLVVSTFLAACAITFAVAPFSAHAQSFAVTASSSQNYTIDGQLDPTLTLVRGQTYQFAVNAAGHPFYIKTQAGSGTGNQYNDGVTNNGLTSGTLTFSVPLSAPAVLFYQCSLHGAMSGQINVLSAPAVPRGGSLALLLLVMCLLAAGDLAFRARVARDPAGGQRLFDRAK